MAAAAKDRFGAMFAGANLVKADGTEIEIDSLRGSDSFIGVYFSAHWCPPCRQFTPLLAKFYTQLKAKGTHKFEIVFASSDRERSAYTEYLGEMPWAAFPYQDRRIAALSAKLKQNGIPTLVILDGDGNVVCRQGRQSVMASPMSEFPFRTPAFGEVFEGLEYVASEGPNKTWDDLKKLDAIGVYFSAHWCGPCKAFTPKLIKTYNKINKSGKRFEIIFASKDRNAEEYTGYFSTMPWLSFPWGTSMGPLGRLLPHQGIPTLVMIDPKTGTVLNPSARPAVEDDAAGAKFPWTLPPAPPLGQGPDVNGDTILTLLVDGMDDVDEADACVEAFQEFAKKTKAGWDAAKTEDDEDYPLEFSYGDDDVDLADRVRGFCGLSRVPAPTLFVLSVPTGMKYMWTGKAGSVPTAKDFGEMVTKFTTGTLAPMAIKAAP